MTRSLGAFLATASAAALAGCSSAGGGGSILPALTPAAATEAPGSGEGEPQSGVSATALRGFPAVNTVEVAFGDGTMTLIVDGESAVFDTSQTTVETLAEGVLAQSVVQADGWTAQEVAFAFGDRPGLTRLVLFDAPTGVMGAISTRVDPSAAPTIPASGAATFDTLLAGTFRYIGLLDDADRELVVARGTMRADFGASRIEGEFPDFDFIVDGVHLETTRLGHDFGLSLRGGIEGDEFTMEGINIGREGPAAIGRFYAMDGRADGVFLGSTGGAPTGIAGALSMGGAEGEIFADMVAGFEGVCGCVEPTPDIPNTGSAKFDAGLSGVLRYGSLVEPAADELLTARGAVTVDFGAGALSGAFADVDFLRGGVIHETTLVGNDFGLEVGGSVAGDQISVTVASTRNEGVGLIEMVGEGSGAITAAPGRLELGASGALSNMTADPVLAGTFAIEGVAPVQ